MSVNQVRSARAESLDVCGAVADELLITFRKRRLGTIQLVTKVFHTESDLTFDDVGTEYHVHLPISGRWVARYRGSDMVATRDAAAVYQPESGSLRGRWAADTRFLAIRMPRDAVHAALTKVIGGPPAANLRFDLSMLTTDARARSWVDLVARVNRDLATPDGLLSHPMVAEPLAESVLVGFLFAVRNSYSDILARPVPPPRPKAIGMAIDLMENDPAAPWTVTELARRCDVSVRTLQSGFGQHQGVSPMGYLRAVRLRRAHEDLRTADPYIGSVAAIAHKWGFHHVGRFAASYAAEYGHTPLRTLRARTNR